MATVTEAGPVTMARQRVEHFVDRVQKIRASLHEVVVGQNDVLEHLLLCALAIARPLLGPEPLAADRLSGDTVRVVILDVSQSMAATERAVQAIERARTTAAGYLRYRPGL